MRAALTVRPRRSAGRPAGRSAEGRPVPILRETQAAAARTVAVEDARPWIVTEAGGIVSPRWIRVKAGAPR